MRRIHGILVFAFVASSGLSLWIGPVAAQAPLSPGGQGPVRIFNTDMAVLEAGEPRKDLPCAVVPNKPLLGFDLRFHSGFDVGIPMKDLAGSENLLTILFRVFAENHQDEPRYFVQRVRVPEIAEDAKGDAYVAGNFEVGEGKYHVDWLMRDRAERVCSGYWDMEASLSQKDRQVQLVIAPNEIEPSQIESFAEEPPVERIQSEPLNVKVLLNYAPQNSHSAALQPVDTTALISILRGIAREPRISKFSLVAFNLNEQKVLYKQEDADKIDFPKLGEALRQLKLGTVHVAHLANKKGETEFLAELIHKELGDEKNRPDAVIFAGPKAMLDSNVQSEALREVGEVQFPVFYMNYNLNPQQVPWRDPIGNAVKYFKGQEYTISRPRDLWFAVTDVVSRIVKSRHGRSMSASSAQ
jgi:hypothetical protein